MKSEIVAVVNQKGGVGKTTTCANLGIGLAKEGKRVLLVDCDPQASLTISLGWSQPDNLPATLADAMRNVVMDAPVNISDMLLHHDEGIDILPANIELSGMEASLVNVMSREAILKQVIEPIKRQYDYIIIDCIYRATTDENGEIPELFVTPGCYTFREIIAPEGYALNEAEMTFEVDKDGNVTGNTMIRDDYTRVSVLKQDESGLPMAGVEFSLLDASGNVRMTAISDMNGLATFERIPYGKYTITETKPLPGYFRSDVSVEVTVDGSFVNPTEPLATITNHPMRIECIKVDNSGRTLSGVEFSLIDARTNTIVEIVTSDEQGRFVFDAIDYGSWVIRETRAPEGYMVMEDVHLEIGEDFVQPKPITFTNIPNHYEFMKVDDRHEPLAGVTFALEDENGNVLRELVSGEDGIVHADNLTFGSYVIRETQTLEGYKLTEETLSFTIDEDYVDPPELYCLVNEREPITAIIQTGVDFVMTPVTWIGAGLVLCSMILYAIWFPKKKNK